MKKQFAYTTLLGLFLAACSSDDSFYGSTTPVVLSSVQDLDLFTCNDYTLGTEVYVEETDSYYTCKTSKFNKAEWEFSSNPKYSSAKTNSSARTNSSANTKYSFDEDFSSSSHSRISSSDSFSEERSSSSYSTYQESSSSKAAPVTYERVNPKDIRYGLMIDPRDGQIYKTVTIGTQTWMAQNLNYAVENKIRGTDIIQKNNWCAGVALPESKYGDCEKNGRLYTWAAANDSVGNARFSEGPCDSWYKDCPTQGICPDGWHIPSTWDWSILVYVSTDSSVDHSSLSSSIHSNKSAPEHLLSNHDLWYTVSGGIFNVYEDFGFNVQPTGLFRYGAPDSSIASFWSNANDDDIISFERDEVWSFNSFNAWRRQRAFAAAIRCIKDTIETDSENLSTTELTPPDFPVSLGPTYSDPPAPEPASTYLNPDIEYGEMVDNRDKQVYKTVVINNQTWMAQNLNYEIAPGLQSWCGGGSDLHEGNCDTYGRLYTWAAANGKTEAECGHGRSCKTTERQGICPDGWYLPTLGQYDTLAHFLSDSEIVPNGTLLKANSDLWEMDGKGIDKVGFSALPAGYRKYRFEATNRTAYFWTSGQESEFSGRAIALRGQYDVMDTTQWEDKELGFSVRCIKY